jgi:hypothetical protein
LRFLSFILLFAGCVGDPGFVCSTDAQCVSNGQMGTCALHNFCSFADPNCPSQLRYGGHSGAFSNLCVDNMVTPDDGGMPDLVGADLAGDPCLPSPSPVSGALLARCIAKRTAITIDGASLEWSTAPLTTIDSTLGGGIIATGFGTGNPNAARANLSGKFSLRWNPSDLYVLGEITDDVRQVQSTTLQNGDAFEVYVRAVSSTPGAYTANDWQFVVNPDNNVQVYRSGTLVTTPGEFLSATTSSGTNWTVEIKIPWSVLGMSGGSLGELAGIDIKLDDLDNPASATMPERTLLWRNNAPATCTECGASSCNPVCSTSAFAGLQLYGP